jgi:hypothetical protein
LWAPESPSRAEKNRVIRIDFGLQWKLRTIVVAVTAKKVHSFFLLGDAFCMIGPGRQQNGGAAMCDFENQPGLQSCICQAAQASVGFLLTTKAVGVRLILVSHNEGFLVKVVSHWGWQSISRPR